MSLKHITVKLLKIKDKEGIIKSAREKKFLIYKRNTYSCQFLVEPLQIRKEKIM
jgi:hypothetical protein